jgi:hypothetical protein
MGSAAPRVRLLPNRSRRAACDDRSYTRQHRVTPQRLLIVLVVVLLIPFVVIGFAGHANIGRPGVLGRSDRHCRRLPKRILRRRDRIRRAVAARHLSFTLPTAAMPLPEVGFGDVAGKSRPTRPSAVAAEISRERSVAPTLHQRSRPPITPRMAVIAFAPPVPVPVGPPASTRDTLPQQAPREGGLPITCVRRLTTVLLSTG